MNGDQISVLVAGSLERPVTPERADAKIAVVSFTDVILIVCDAGTKVVLVTNDPNKLKQRLRTAEYRTIIGTAKFNRLWSHINAGKVIFTTSASLNPTDPWTRDYFIFALGGLEGYICRSDSACATIDQLRRTAVKEVCTDLGLQEAMFPHENHGGNLVRLKDLGGKDVCIVARKYLTESLCPHGIACAAAAYNAALGCKLVVINWTNDEDGDSAIEGTGHADMVVSPWDPDGGKVVVPQIRNADINAFTDRAVLRQRLRRLAVKLDGIAAELGNHNLHVTRIPQPLLSQDDFYTLTTKDPSYLPTVNTLPLKVNNRWTFISPTHSSAISALADLCRRRLKSPPPLPVPTRTIVARNLLALQQAYSTAKAAEKHLHSLYSSVGRHHEVLWPGVMYQAGGGIHCITAHVYLSLSSTDTTKNVPVAPPAMFPCDSANWPPATGNACRWCVEKSGRRTLAHHRCPPVGGKTHLCEDHWPFLAAALASRPLSDQWGYLYRNCPY